jgi:hypothetical protein
MMLFLGPDVQFGEAQLEELLAWTITPYKLSFPPSLCSLLPVVEEYGLIFNHGGRGRRRRRRRK